MHPVYALTIMYRTIATVAPALFCFTVSVVFRKRPSFSFAYIPFLVLVTFGYVLIGLFYCTLLKRTLVTNTYVTGAISLRMFILFAG